MSTFPSEKTSTSTGSPRISSGRLIIWGGLLIVLAIAGFELWVKQSFQKKWEVLQNRFEVGSRIGGKASHLTNLEVSELLDGKTPAFKGHPGQIETVAKYYEAYVWKSLFKRKFTEPPENPERVNLYAIYSGDVHPDLIKYRTPEKKPAEGFFAAHMMYVYYGPEDPDTKVREVVEIVMERKKYADEIGQLPDRAELERRHKNNLASVIGDLQKDGRRRSQDEIDKLDTWKNPQPLSNENSNNLPPPNASQNLSPAAKEALRAAEAAKADPLVKPKEAPKATSSASTDSPERPRATSSAKTISPETSGGVVDGLKPKQTP